LHSHSRPLVAQDPQKTNPPPFPRSGAQTGPEQTRSTLSSFPDPAAAERWLCTTFTGLVFCMWPIPEPASA
jgi:hypothetical protein